MLKDSVNNFLNNLGINLEGSTVLLGVSGGVDSMVLLHLMVNEFPHTQFIAAHVNHGLREDANRDESLVREQSLDYGVKYLSTSLNPKSIPAKQSVELWGREQRYQYFNEIVEKHKVHWVMTAHHLEDQSETLFQRIGRGSGIKGLGGIQHWRKPNVLRPLIHCSKKSLIAYAEENGVLWREDKSNTSLDHERNWYRHQYLPSIGLGDSEKGAMGRMAEFVQNWLPRARKQMFQELVWSKEKAGMVLPLRALNTSPLEPFLLVQLYLEQKGINLRETHFSELEHQLKNGLEVGVSLSQNKTLRGNQNYLWVEEVQNWEQRQPKEVVFHYNSSDSPYNSSFQGIWYGRCYTLYVRSYSRGGDFEIQKKKGWRVFLDAGKFKNPLHIRSWKNGDRFSPLGTPSCSRKLKDYFNGIKLSMDKKREQMLVCDGDIIAWLPALEISENYKITENSKEILELEIQWQK